VHEISFFFASSSLVATKASVSRTSFSLLKQRKQAQQDQFFFLFLFFWLRDREE
jgi:hypothetical protein